MRSEQQIFEDLSNLCVSPGYAHAIAYFCHEAHVQYYEGDTITVEDMAKPYQRERLILTEISALIGLLLKHPIDLAMPEPDLLQKYISQTKELLFQLHEAIFPNANGLINISNTSKDSPNREQFFRESIFYTGKSAYMFQYTELAVMKYQADDHWLLNNKGFTILDASLVVKAIMQLQEQHLHEKSELFAEIHPDQWDFVSIYVFSIEDVYRYCSVDKNVIDNILLSFVFPENEHNMKLKAIDDFNLTNVFPLIKIGETDFLLFDFYILAEALYEAPFYWMLKDRNYVVQASKNRGNFTEKFSADRLELVFGQGNVFRNVNVTGKKGEMLAEIDVLVIFSNRAIIVQCKSKRLNIDARKGVYKQIVNDFSKAIQDSYDQAKKCATYLNGKGINLVCNGKQIDILDNIEEIYLVCTICDHYPALAMQTRLLLDFSSEGMVFSPFVIDIFFLDVMTEMAQSPLYFLSYLNRRAIFNDSVLSSHELTIFSHHITNNLWVMNGTDSMLFDDSFVANVDLAMAVRRDNANGPSEPDGIIKLYNTTYLGDIIKQLAYKPDPIALDLGFLLLKLESDSVASISSWLKDSCNNFEEGKYYGLSTRLENEGFTIHITSDNIEIAKKGLLYKIELNKYISKAFSWFGICIDPCTNSIRFVLRIESEWKNDDYINQHLKENPL